MPSIDIHIDDGPTDVVCNKRIVICGSSSLYDSVAKVAKEYEDVQGAQVFCTLLQDQASSNLVVGRWMPNISYADEVVVVVDESCSIDEHFRSQLLLLSKRGIPIRLRIFSERRIAPSEVESSKNLGGRPDYIGGEGH